MTEDELARFAADSIGNGSKSFAAAAKLFDADTRRSVILLYSWCRHCDDVVDGQEAGSAIRCFDVRTPIERIESLKADTARAFAGETGKLHPAFAALGVVARRHAIPQALADEHLAGFAMDVEERRYETLDDLMLYCWRVAGVVGVMMARIMGVSDAPTLARAGDLGLAFQLTNIARDVVDDARAGRIYVPLDWLREEGMAPEGLADPANRAAVTRLRARLVAAAEPHYASARIGIDVLPRRSAWAIATAHGVYRAIGQKLVAAGEGAFDTRISTTRAEKLGFIAKGARIAALRGGGSGSRNGLWSPPAGY